MHNVLLQRSPGVDGSKATDVCKQNSIALYVLLKLDGISFSFCFFSLLFRGVANSKEHSLHRCKPEGQLQQVYEKNHPNASSCCKEVLDVLVARLENQHSRKNRRCG